MHSAVGAGAWLNLSKRLSIVHHGSIMCFASKSCFKFERQNVIIVNTINGSS